MDGGIDVPLTSMLVLFSRRFKVKFVFLPVFPVHFTLTILRAGGMDIPLMVLLVRFNVDLW